MYLDVWKKRKLSATHNLISKTTASLPEIDFNLISGKYDTVPDVRPDLRVRQSTAYNFI